MGGKKTSLEGVLKKLGGKSNKYRRELKGERLGGLVVTVLGWTNGRLAGSRGFSGKGCGDGEGQKRGCGTKKKKGGGVPGCTHLKKIFFFGGFETRICRRETDPQVKPHLCHFPPPPQKKGHVTLQVVFFFTQSVFSRFGSVFPPPKNPVLFFLTLSLSFCEKNSAVGFSIPCEKKEREGKLALLGGGEIGKKRSFGGKKSFSSHSAFHVCQALGSWVVGRKTKGGGGGNKEGGGKLEGGKQGRGGKTRKGKLATRRVRPHPSSTMRERERSDGTFSSTLCCRLPRIKNV